MGAPRTASSDRWYGAALGAQLLSLLGGFIGAVLALAAGSATYAAIIAFGAVGIIVICSRIRGAIRRRTLAAITRQLEDPSLGTVTYDDDAEGWRATATIDGKRMNITVGGDMHPASELLAHARDVIGADKTFAAKVRTFLERETERAELIAYADEIRTLEPDDLCLFWPDRPDDGMIYFRHPEGVENGRVWRCDYVGREPRGLGFDD